MMAPPPFGDLPAGEFAAISADPPWHFRAYTALTKSNWVSRRDAEKHYPVLGLEDIKAMPVKALAARNTHLFLWVTGPCLPKAFEVMEAWGFRYSGVAFTWIKLKKSFDANAATLLPPFYFDSDFHTGLGLTTRKNAEICLLGRRGSPKRLSREVRELIIAPRREHSRKPEEAYDRIMQYGSGPYLELFARQRRAGWSSWGNQVGHFAHNGAHISAPVLAKERPITAIMDEIGERIREGLLECP